MNTTRQLLPLLALAAGLLSLPTTARAVEDPAAAAPGRLVRFCCAPCTEDFAKDPAKYLQRLAAATPAPPVPPAHAKH